MQILLQIMYNKTATKKQTNMKEIISFVYHDVGFFVVVFFV
jgi:hypothetical protein